MLQPRPFLSLRGFVLLASALSAAVSGALADTRTGTAIPPPCLQANGMESAQAHGLWRLTLPGVGLAGTLILSQHPDFPASLRGHLNYVGANGQAVRAIASGDLEQGRLDLDESSDGKRLTAVWSGHVTPGLCGSEIRGEWEDLDRQVKSTFVLSRDTQASYQVPADPSHAGDTTLATPSAASPASSATQSPADPTPPRNSTSRPNVASGSGEGVRSGDSALRMGRDDTADD